MNSLLNIILSADFELVGDIIELSFIGVTFIIAIIIMIIMLKNRKKEKKLNEMTEVRDGENAESTDFFREESEE